MERDIEGKYPPPVKHGPKVIGKKLFFNVFNFLEKTERIDQMFKEDKYRDPDAELLEEELDNLPEEDYNTYVHCRFTSQIDLKGRRYNITSEIRSSINTIDCVHQTLQELNKFYSCNMEFTTLTVNVVVSEGYFSKDHKADFHLSLKNGKAEWHADSKPINDFEIQVFNLLNLDPNDPWFDVMS